MRSRCGLVEIDPTNDHAVLQAQASRQVYSRNLDQSGKHSAKSVPTTKRGSPHLRKTLYQIVCTYLKRSPADEPVYQFLDKKRAEGKPYFVYMTAAQNKFLRIYYARVKECLEAFDERQDTVQN